MSTVNPPTWTMSDKSTTSLRRPPEGPRAGRDNHRLTRLETHNHVVEHEFQGAAKMNIDNWEINQRELFALDICRGLSRGKVQLAPGSAVPCLVIESAITADHKHIKAVMVPGSNCRVAGYIAAQKFISGDGWAPLAAVPCFMVKSVIRTYNKDVQAIMVPGNNSRIAVMPPDMNSKSLTDGPQLFPSHHL